MDWTSLSREIALSTVRGSLALMFENCFVFAVVIVLLTSGVVSLSKTRSGSGWFENKLRSGSGWFLTFCRWDLTFCGSFSVWLP